MTLLTFQRSEGLFETLYRQMVNVDGLPHEHVVEYNTSEGNWLQITYEHIMDQSGRSIATVDRRGLWHVEGVEHPFSDVIIDLNNLNDA